MYVANTVSYIGDDYGTPISRLMLEEILLHFLLVQWMIPY